MWYKLHTVSATSSGSTSRTSCGQLVADGDEVLAELLRHRGRLLRHHWLLVHTHDQGLYGLDAVDSGLAFPSTDDPVVGREEHVLRPTHRHPVHRKLVCAGVPVEDHLQLGGGHVEAGAGRPDVAVVPGDHRVLDHVRRDQLVVDIALPAHGGAWEIEEGAGRTLGSSRGTPPARGSFGDNTLLAGGHQERAAAAGRTTF